MLKENLALKLNEDKRKNWKETHIHNLIENG